MQKTPGRRVTIIIIIMQKVYSYGRNGLRKGIVGQLAEEHLDSGNCSTPKLCWQKIKSIDKI